MKLMLDTDTCIFLIKRKPAVVLERLLRCEVGDVGISSITLAELRFGVAKSKRREKNAQALDEFIVPLEVAPFDDKAALAYGDVRRDLEAAGTPIGAMDMLIAAHAVSLGITMVTHNTGEFGRISRMEVVDWTA
jgi:tRNA(fMet)-specific endonuclease VapC